MNSKSKPNYTVAHRALHWTTAILMFVLFITGFLRMFWMSKRTILNAVEQNVTGVTLTNDQTRGITKGIINPMWQWHEYAAYFLASFFILRVLYMLFEGIRFPNPFSKNVSLKERLQGGIYAVFYIFILVSVITGFYLKWGGNRDLKETMETIHKWAVYWFPIYILIHFAGIWVAELTNKKGVVSKMIGGDSL